MMKFCETENKSLTNNIWEEADAKALNISSLSVCGILWLFVNKVIISKEAINTKIFGHEEIR